MRLASTLLIAALVLAGCGDADTDDPATTTTTLREVTSSTTTPPVPEDG